MKKRILSILLVILMIFSWMPTDVLAADTEYSVRIHAATPDIEFKNASDGTVPAAKSMEDGYTVYSMKAEKGIYTYSAPGYGTGTINITGEADIFLRAVNYTFSNSGCGFQMKVTNTADPSLVYISPVTTGKSVSLLVPVLGWGTAYQYQFIPQDASYCPFYGDLWVLPGTTDFEGFKSKSYNLSDSGQYVMGKKTTMEFRVPAGAKLGVYALVKFYRPPVKYDTKLIKTEDGFDVYEAYVASPCGGNYYYTVSKQGYVTTSRVFQDNASSITVTEADISGDPNQQLDQQYEASLISNGNVAKAISLKPREEFAIWTSRAWQAIDSITGNRYVEPDKHYYVIDGDSVSVDDIGTVTAVKNGISLVAVTYDAMKYEGDIYSAVKSDSVGVFAFSVGGSAEGLSTGLSALSDLDTFYFAKTLRVDGNPNVVTKDYATYTFKPTATDNSEISVSACSVYGYPTPAASAWQNYTKNEDGSFTIRLYEGRNIVKIQAGDRVACHVINCKGSDVTVTNMSAPDTAPKADESVQIGFTNIISPLPKLGAIYNPGFGGTVYLTGTLMNDADNSSVTVNSTGVQYNLNTSAAISSNLDKAGNYTLSGTRIHAGAYGSEPTTHLALSRQSEGGSYSSGDTPSTEGMYSYLPEVSFAVESADHEATAEAILTLFNDIGDVTYDEACYGRMLKARKAYDGASAAVKALISDTQLKVLTDAEKEYTRLDEAAVGSGIEKRTIDGKEYYALTNAAQLTYFAKLVNGMLADTAQNSAANAVLDDDITVNTAVLGANHTLMTAGTSEWVPIGSIASPYTGIFDGNGHAVSGIYINTQSVTTPGFFGVSSGTIRNFSLGDTYIRTSAKPDSNTGAAGVCSVNSGTIDKVIFDGYVGAEDHVGGIVSINNGTISNCTFLGKAEAKGTVTGYAGGIAYYTKGNINHCISTGSVLAQNGDYAGAAGIVYNVGASAIVEYCYSSSSVTGRTNAGGIAGNAIAGARISACYSTGKITANKNPGGGILAEPGDPANFGLPSYYLTGSVTGGADITGKAIGKSAAQFAGGEVAYLMGGEYGQLLGSDAFPVFNNGSNRVFKTGDGYVNASAEAAIRMIDAIGTVAADGGENCFSNLTAAQSCYAMLSDIEKANVTNADVLVQKQADYDSAVSGLAAQIEALSGTADGSVISAAKSMFLGYAARGGDPSKITNAGKIAAAAAVYYTSMEDSITGGIETRTIDGKEYYVLTNAAELIWFTNTVNGKLASKAPAKPDASAILANDISVNDSLLNSILDQSGNIINSISVIETPWASIGGTYTGTFDGNGHTVSGIYSNDPDGTFAMFGTVKGEVLNLRVSDSYINAASTAGIAQTVDASGVLSGCGFEGVLKGKMKAGGIALSAYGRVLNCYSTGTMSLTTNLENSSIMGGIASDINNALSVKNCFSTCTYSGGWATGGIAGIVQSARTKFIDNCWYLDSTVNKGIGKDSGTVSMGITAFSGEQLKSGELAYRLGTAFGQRIGMDGHPVLNSGSNTVYHAGGVYTNGSKETAIALIDEIGKVSLDGGENCFGRVTAAKNCFDGLSEAEKDKIGNASVLTEALAAYDAVVTGLETDINAIYPLNKDDRDIKYKEALAAIEAYTARGGDVKKITNYATLQKAADDLVPLLTQWMQEDVEASIKTRNIDGAEYYIIKDANALSWFASLVNGTLKTGTAQDAAANAVLDADITLNQNLMATILDETKSLRNDKLTGVTVWEPMKAYSGIFDGAGHTISGIYYSTSTAGFGIFNSVSGTVKNLNVRDSVLYGTATSTSGSGTGGIAGVLNSGGVINGCSFSGLVRGTVSVGGLVGVNSGKVSLCHVTDAYIVSTANTMLIYTGGLAGNNKGTVENSYMHGTVKAAGGNANSQRLGGIAGYNDAAGIISNCYSICTIAGMTKGFGAIAGINSGSGKVQKCYYLAGTAPTGIGAASAAGTADLDDVAKGKTAADFADGSVALALGDAYAQRIGVDAYPVFLKDVPPIEVFGAPDADVPLNGSVTLKAVLAKGADTAVYQWYSDTENSNQNGTAVEGATSALFNPDTTAAGTVYYYCVSGLYTSRPVRVRVVQTYTLTVVNGTDITNSGPYASGTAVAIRANEPEDGRVFSGWSCDRQDGVFEDAAKPDTKFTMPAADTVIAATYRTLPKEDTIVVYFTLLGDSEHEGGTSHTLKQNNLETWISRTKVTLNKESTVGDAFKKVLDSKGYGYAGLSKNYISSIITPDGLTLSEFTNGSLSGWMYTVNGTHPKVGLNACKLSDGDEIIWHYTDDYTKEEGSEEWSGSGSTTGNTGNTTVTPTATVSGGTASASVTLDDMKDAIAGAKSSGSAIVVKPKATGTVSYMKIEIGKDALNAIGQQTSSDLIVQTPVGSVTIPHNVLSSIVSQATGSTVTVSVEAVEKTALSAEQKKAVGDNFVFDISILSGGKKISSFGGGNVTISLPYALKSGQDPKNVTVWYLNNNGGLEKVPCTYDKEKEMATFTTPHLSYYIVGYAVETVEWKNPFADVKATDWFYSKVAFAVQKGLFSGTSATTFSPNSQMTRAMLVTVLYNLEGKPAVTGVNGYKDVKDGEWYTNAVIWANANNVVAGYGSGEFGVNDNVTREQMATILYNYAKLKGYDISAKAELTSYKDGGKISSYALNAVQWAAGAELMSGKGNGVFDPLGMATRAEVASVLQSFVEAFLKLYS